MSEKTKRISYQCQGSAHRYCNDIECECKCHRGQKRVASVKVN